jgi:hypothetical protein
MKTALRNRLATALLLAPLAALTAGAAHAEYATVYGAQPRYVYEPSYTQQYHRDNRAPRISDVTPTQGERVSERGRTHITARVSDRGAGIDARSIRLHVDGRDVSGLARFDGDEVRYREDLQPGRHVARLVVRDRAGNATRQDWSFFVANDVGRGDRHGFYDGRGRGETYGYYGGR